MMKLLPLQHRVRFEVFARRFTVALLAIAFTWVVPAMVWASRGDEEVPSHDARLDNYAQNVILEPGGTALTWFLTVLLALLCVGVMFKNANRSHLD